MYTEILKLFSIALKSKSHNITRDFYEIKKLSSKKSLLQFVKNAQVKLQNDLYKDLVKFKKNYSYKLGDINAKIIPNLDSSNLIIIHDIIGIRNFINGSPCFAISLSLIRDKKLFAGIIFNPILNEMFMTEVEHGSYFNNMKLKYKDAISRSSGDFPIYTTDNIQKLVTNEEVVWDISNIRVTGSIILDICYLTIKKINNVYLFNEYLLSYLQLIILYAKEAGVDYNVVTSEDRLHSIKFHV